MPRSFARSFFTSAFVFSSLSIAMAGPLEEGIAAFEHYDYSKALQLLEPLAKDGNPAAQRVLGRMFMNGWGVNHDHEAALKWYGSAAEKGDAAAQFLYGNMLYRGEAGPQDIPGMVKWHTLSAAQGFNYAMVEMGNMYSLGVGVQQNLVQSYVWYSLALSHGLRDVEPLLQLVANKLTAEQITEAQQLARQWKPTK